MSSPLEGIKVLDLSIAVAAPLGVSKVLFPNTSAQLVVTADRIRRIIYRLAKIIMYSLLYIVRIRTIFPQDTSCEEEIIAKC